MSQYFENDEKVKSNITLKEVEVKNIKYYFYTDNGIFNKSGLDYGTRLLLNNLDITGKTSFLDIGCGAGVVGIYLRKLNKDFTVDMCDINKRAVDLTNKGLKKNNLVDNAFISDAYSNIESKYDCIISNPPIHAGKEKVYEIIRGASSHLISNGELWIVMRKDQGALSMMNDNKDIYNFEIITKDKGFLIIKARVI
ncbi:MAG: class I SAM-dependent methyltransferase [Bacilli bacterium]|nr:class I SAM-dependent methyltransferase [Bacilli bacterium]